MITFCTSEEFTLQIEGVGRTEYNIILIQEIGKDFSEALGLHINATADAHKSSAISHGSGSVEARLDNITDGVITRDANGDILSMMTFGETTVFNRDVNGDIESWENDTHVWTLTKTNGKITGWTLTEKP